MEPRNYLANAGATPPTKPGSPSNGYPQTVVPGVNEATAPGPFWFYKVGEALRAIIAGSGQTPSDDDLSQVLNGIKRFAGGNVTTKSATATLTLDEAGLILVDATAGNVTLTLPSAADLAALGYTFVRTDGSANTVTIAADGAEAVGGAASISLAVGDIRSVKSDGVNEFHLDADNAYASETARGLIELATTAEVAALADTLRAITPAGLDSVFGRSLAAAGYQKLPGGLIVQWGYVDFTSSATQNWTYPVAFPNAAIFVAGQLRANGAINVSINTKDSPGLSSTTMYMSDGVARAYSSFNIAIGY